MSDVEEVVKAATEFLYKVRDAHDITDLRVEELTVPDGDTSEWVLTLSWRRPSDTRPSSTVSGFLGLSQSREYKVFHVDIDGQVQEMKMRIVNHNDSGEN